MPQTQIRSHARIDAQNCDFVIDRNFLISVASSALETASFSDLRNSCDIFSGVLNPSAEIDHQSERTPVLVCRPSKIEVGLGPKGERWCDFSSKN
jgi:hypothetical protein